jgi:elongation factor P
MANVQATQINKGAVITLDGVYHKVIERDHKTPGNKRGIIHLKLKNLEAGGHVSKRFATSDFLDTAYISKRNCQYLYQEPTGYVFMDNESYEQFTLSEDLVGEQMKFVPLNADVSIGYIDDRPMELDLPASMSLTVVESEPAIRGNTATGVTKLAVTDTGLEVKVPQHIEVGELISVDTRTGDFMGRAKE